MNLNQVTIPVLDMAPACRFYQRLGFVQIVDTPHYARFECPQGEATFSLSLADEVPRNGAILYFEHEQLDRWYEQLCAQGIEFEHAPRDERYLWREALLRDPSGNRIKLYWAGGNRRHPPWRVELRDPTAVQGD